MTRLTDRVPYLREAYDRIDAYPTRHRLAALVGVLVLYGLVNGVLAHVVIADLVRVVLFVVTLFLLVSLLTPWVLSADRDDRALAVAVSVLVFAGLGILGDLVPHVLRTAGYVAIATIAVVVWATFFAEDDDAEGVTT